MSSEVITHPTWNRLHVARRVRDIAKSMTRLSRLGRSTFPMIVHRRLRRGVQPSLRLKVWETLLPRSVHRPPAKPYLAFVAMAGEMKPKAASGDVPEVSPAQVAAFRLSRHHLVKRAPAGDLARVAGDMAGVQAQLMSAAQISLWARTRGLRPEDIERALWE